MIIGDSSSWDDFFELGLIPKILNYVITTWEQMPRPRASDLEDDISVKLYSALIKNKNRNDHAFLILYQAVEVDLDLEKVTGIKDIVFYPSNQEDIYLCLEAKRLNAVISGVQRSLADEYVKEGMQRFVDRKYAPSVRHGAMLAYVLDGNINRAIKNVRNNIHRRRKELCMASNGDFNDSTFRPDDSNSKETQHLRKDEKDHFRIHHLFV